MAVVNVRLPDGQVIGLDEEKYRAGLEAMYEAFTRPIDWGALGFDAHLRSHHFLAYDEAAPNCIRTHGCTYERRPPPEYDFFAHDRTKG